MRRSYRFAGLIALGLTVLIAAGPRLSESSRESVQLTVVTYDQLVEAVKQHRGKIVLVDVWFEQCVPCKIGFPKLLALHRKYRDQGLVAITVNVDDPADTATKQKIVNFLQSSQATCINLQVSESPDIWSKLGIKSVPSVFMFDREGRMLRKWTDGVDYGQIATRVAAEISTTEPK